MTELTINGFHLIGAEKYTSLIKEIKIFNWGETIILDCLYDPVERIPYKITFSGCDLLTWSIHDSEETNEPLADLIDFIIQEKETKEKRTAILYTKGFELSIDYSDIKVEKDWGN